ncbi:MAG: PqqD family protein [Magnetococcales bacterium]|nr:PqqD family protein [Magnetococcales bacterium]
MLDVQRGLYFGVGGVGSRIWEILQQPISIGEICQLICAEFEVDEDKCLADLLGYFPRLLKNNIVRIL